MPVAMFLTFLIVHFRYGEAAEKGIIRGRQRGLFIPAI